MGPVPGTDDPLLDKLAREKQNRDAGKPTAGRPREEGAYRSGPYGADRKPRPGGAGKGEPRKEDGAMVRLRFNVGHNIRVRPSDFVGAIAAEANVSGKSLGYIGIGEKYSFVDVPADLAQRIVKAMTGNVVKGRKVKVDQVEKF
jgi:ATP-dependent RNA helicase DeaD